MNSPAQGPRAFLVGGGIAALAAVRYLLRDGLLAPMQYCGVIFSCRLTT